MSGAVRNVIFDLGGVVLDWNPDHIVSRIESASELRASLKDALFGHADWRLFDRGALSESELIERLESRLGKTRQEVTAILDTVRDSLVEKPDTVKLIRALRARGIPLYCLSNMPTAVQMMKPEPDVFMHLLDAFKLRPQECVFIDDVLANIESARQVGLHTVWFKDAAQCRRELDQLLGKELAQFSNAIGESHDGR
jgi:putative hydrolase of the HAD superfamily